MKKSVGRKFRLFAAAVFAAMFAAAAMSFGVAAEDFYLDCRSEGTKIVLEFNADEGCANEIYVSADGGEYVLAGVSKDGSFEYKGAVNEEYAFKILDFKEEDGVKVYSEVERYAYTATAPKAPTGTKVSFDGSDFSLSWSASSGAQGYQVYKIVDGKYVLADEVTGKSCKINHGASYGEEHSFAVRAYRVYEGKRYYSDYSKTFKIITKPQKASGLAQSSYNSTSMKITWKAAKGADGYAVYRYGPDTDSKYKFLGYTKNLYYNVTGIPAGRLQKVKIVSYKETDSGKLYASEATITRPAAPAVTSSFKQSSVGVNSAKISWSKVTCATAYEIYVYNSSTEKYTLRHTVTGTSKTLSGLASGSTYKIKLVAVREYNGKKYRGSGKVINVYTSPAKVGGTKVSERTTSSFTFTWNKTTGAQGYDIYRYNAKTDKYDKVKGGVTGNSYTVSSLNPGTIQYFRVKAYRTIGGVKYSSSYSDKITCVTKLKASGSFKCENFIEGVNLSWGKISGTKGYRIYVSDSKNGSYKCVKTIADANTTSCKITGLTGGKTYYYKVCGYKMSDGDYYIGQTKLVKAGPYKNHDFIKILNSYKQSKSIQVLNSDFKISNSRKNAIMKLVNNYSRNHVTGFALVDIKSGAAIIYNGNTYVPTASTAKGPYMCYVLTQQIDKGYASMSELLTYKASQKRGGSGVIQYSQIGTKYSIKTVIHNICRYSDNVGYYMLQDRFSYVGFNKWMKSLGNKTFLNGSNIRWGQISSKDSAKVWSEIYRYFYNGKYGDFFKEELLTSGYPNFRDYIGDKYPVASKSGATNVGWNDTGIVFKGDNPYILILLTNDNYLNPDYYYQRNMTLQLDALHDELVAYNNSK